MNDSHAEATAADTIFIERLLPGPIERLWSYVTEPDLRAQWLAGGETDAQEGGRIELRFNHADLSSEKTPPAAYVDYNCEIVFEGKVLRCEPPHHFAFTWGDGSEVAFALSEAENDMVRLAITHTRLPGKPAMISVSSGWHAHLAILEDQLNQTEPRPFWTTMLALENTYRERLQ